MMRVLPSKPVTLRSTLTDQDEAQVTPAGAVVVTAFDAAGAQVATGNATVAGSVASFVMTATALGVYRVTWIYTVAGQGVTTITTWFEAVGAHPFTIAEARAFDGAKLADDTKYPTEAIVAGRDHVMEYLENRLGFSPVPRRKRVVIDASGVEYVRLPDLYVSALVSASLEGELIAVDDLALDADLGRAYRDAGVWSAGTRNAVVLTYDCGLATVPAPIQRAALLLVTDILVGSNMDPRTLTFSDDLGTRTLTILPREVDDIIKRYSERSSVLR